MAGPADRILVLGAGQAGAALVAKLRERGHEGPITLVGAEPAPPYQRPPLSKKYLLGEMPRERLFLRPESWYAEKGIDLALGVRAEAIDREARTVALSDGRALAYDGLALCLGSRPRRWPGDRGGALPGVHLVRDLADIDELAPGFEPQGDAPPRLVVVGGGYIGLEAAAVARSRGLHVTVLEAAPRLLARVACAETAAAVAELHRARGVEIRTGAALDRLEPGEDGRLARAVLADGEAIPADVAVIGIGVIPNAELAEAAGLATENGVRADETCATSDPRIVAAGDCASFPWRGRRIRLESVQNAIDMAEAAATTLAGEAAPYDPLPWFWSDQFDAKLQIAGLALDWDRIVAREGARPGALSHWYFAGAELIAVDALNDPRAYMTGKRWLEAGRSPDPEALADPGTDLKSL